MFGYTSKLQISRFDADFIAILRSYIFEFFTKCTVTLTQLLDQTLAKHVVVIEFSLDNQSRGYDNDERVDIYSDRKPKPIQLVKTFFLYFITV